MTDRSSEDRAPGAGWLAAAGGRSFVGGVVHGALLAAGRALADPVAVLPALVHRLTGSSLWVGGFAALLAAAGMVPQVVVARFVQPRPRKKPVLLAAVLIRASAWTLLGLLIAALGPDHPRALLAAMVGLLTLFSATGALGGVPYVDVIGKVIPRGRRGTFFAAREAAGSLLALGSSALAGALMRLEWPLGYAALFVTSGLLLYLASAGVLAIREPPGRHEAPLPWRAWFRSLAEPVRRLRGLTLQTWLTGASLLALPHYVVYARELGAPESALGWFIGAGVAGGLAADLAWARLVDRWGARRMIAVCASLAAGAPALALLAPRLGWPVLVGVLALTGATQAGRKVGFSSALLEVARPGRRATCGATYALLGLPTALFPLLGGLLAGWLSYPALFGLTLGGLLVANLTTRAWARRA